HGRAAELGAIRACLAHARTGRSSVLLVVGEAGSGKTALLDQMRRFAQHVIPEFRDRHAEATNSR
ncbi:ATP-binding protein, partial [Mycolicibacterium sp.]